MFQDFPCSTCSLAPLLVQPSSLAAPPYTIPQRLFFSRVLQPSLTSGTWPVPSLHQAHLHGTLLILQHSTLRAPRRRTPLLHGALSSIHTSITLPSGQTASVSRAGTPLLSPFLSLKIAWLITRAESMLAQSTGEWMNGWEHVKWLSFRILKRKDVYV